ncbi:30S ribosomal protein S11 [Candidatus Nomurabacteria bacterium]|uniref:Small ribosomal subunit protein uS11 n=1 Tax=candidate division WWE3 bacterium TaxID=2053526 RepID=A0A955DZI3_UNCKA|nr:30S ribosomal protein S11 [candidate division WWE3 bacterium]MCB9823758.1 30S ribosomal protein S11 [Candidatus Nomurabacteria bacterium]MCB9826836.1 30S ribosomal protein S11 [Candidatus Nomurabacteria bacterium]MCB9827553.1 30S ribosomal protein S11 [Candidatus Nomurabacteria bacterium]
MAVQKKKKSSKSKSITPSSGRVYILAGFNNTLITFTDDKGNVLFSGSTGKAGFKGSRKSTPFAATKSTEATAQAAYESGMREVAVLVKGPGMGRIASIKALKSAGLRVTSIADITPIPHNGCRPKNKRRV